MTIIAYDMTYFYYKSGSSCDRWNLIHPNVNTLWSLINIPLFSQLTKYYVIILSRVHNIRREESVLL